MEGAAGTLVHLGLIGLVSAWVVIAASVMANQWFRLDANAFSDLGAQTARMPWIFNYGMMGVGVVICVYSWALGVFASNRVETSSATFFMVSGAFLVLIGYFHEGTYPHLFVSYWFFIQSAVAIIAWGTGSMLEGERRTGALIAAMGILSAVAAAMVPWQSIGEAEAFGIAVIDVWTVAVALQLRRRRDRTGLEKADLTVSSFKLVK